MSIKDEPKNNKIKNNTECIGLIHTNISTTDETIKQYKKYKTYDMKKVHN